MSVRNPVKPKQFTERQRLATEKEAKTLYDRAHVFFERGKFVEGLLPLKQAIKTHEDLGNEGYVEGLQDQLRSANIVSKAMKSIQKIHTTRPEVTWSETGVHLIAREACENLANHHRNVFFELSFLLGKKHPLTLEHKEEAERIKTYLESLNNGKRK